MMSFCRQIDMVFYYFCKDEGRKMRPSGYLHCYCDRSLKERPFIVAVRADYCQFNILSDFKMACRC